MTVAAILLVYAASVGTVGSRMLGRARWAARAPLLLALTPAIVAVARGHVPVA